MRLWGAPAPCFLGLSHGWRVCNVHHTLFFFLFFCMTRRCSATANGFSVPHHAWRLCTTAAMLMISSFLQAEAARFGVHGNAKSEQSTLTHFSPGGALTIGVTAVFCRLNRGKYSCREKCRPLKTCWLFETCV